MSRQVFAAMSICLTAYQQIVTLTTGLLSIADDDREQKLCTNDDDDCHRINNH